MELERLAPAPHPFFEAVVGVAAGLSLDIALQVGVRGGELVAAEGGIEVYEIGCTGGCEVGNGNVEEHVQAVAAAVVEGIIQLDFASRSAGTGVHVVAQRGLAIKGSVRRPIAPGKAGV